MPVTLDERLRYHPDPGDQERTRSKKRVEATRSKRRVDGRCRLIEDHVDLSGKRVVDLGCSGGYFGFEWADVVSTYIGVDADDVVIERNRNVAQQQSATNLEFRRTAITPSFIRGLGPVDVALFLSVFHHILATSRAYEWNRPPEFDPFDLLRALQERVDVLVFETGYPDEGFEWCERLPPMTPTPRAWVERVLRDAGFRYVEVIPASTYHGSMDGLRRYIALTLGYAKHPRPLGGRIASRLLRVDPRDNRDLFIARNGQCR